jgi:Tn3 transposase DDE domain
LAASLLCLRRSGFGTPLPAKRRRSRVRLAASRCFIDGFTHQHEPRAQLSDLQTSICAVLVAQACNVGYAPLVDETIPALREARVKYVARHYIRPETLIAANARIVDYHAATELATRWGDGVVASIDGLRFVVPNRTIHAGFNRRYYHRRRGVTALTTTADHHAALHTVVVPGTQPDALYLLDGLLDPQTSVRPREVMTDTAGYTDVVFGSSCSWATSSPRGWPTPAAAASGGSTRSPTTGRSTSSPTTASTRP